ncbi:Endonuclease/exonuclease/phosphatase, partial [Schizophyllum fasciatum]
MRKAVAKVASMNINGFGTLVRDHPCNKWGQMCRMMNDKGIAIMMLQETHLTVATRLALENMYARNLKIINSEAPIEPSRRGGVAFVLNKRFVNTSDIKTTEIEPGRALLMTMKWHGNEERRLLAIYAPANSAVDRRDFFKKIREYFEQRPDAPRPHVMAGDFNMLEAELDCAPVPNDASESSTEEFDRLKITLGIKTTDGWRATFPDKREYTHYGNGAQGARASRIDRIYVTDELFASARGWAIEDPGVRTDHRMVSVQLTSESAPLVGRGRWKLSPFLIKDRRVKEYTKERGMNAMRALENQISSGIRTEAENPQMILKTFKEEITKFAKERQKAIVPRTLQEIQALRAELRETNKNKSISETKRASDGAALSKQIQELERKRLQQAKANARARHRHEGHTPTKYLSGINKEVKAREMIHALETGNRCPRSGDPIYVKKSDEMAELARKYHQDLQKDKQEVDPNLRERAIRESLDHVELKLTDEEREEMEGPPSRDEIQGALHFAKNGSAAGLDGIPYELWKTLDDRFTEDTRCKDKQTFDVVTLLHAVFCDVYWYGVVPNSGFADGWMCPLYKKNERTKISNYRPITLLNTDYKLLTKVLAIRL